MTYLPEPRVEKFGATSGDQISSPIAYDRERSLHDIFGERADALPDAIAIVCGEGSLTYADLDRLTDALAGYLIEHGINKGDIVGLAMPRSLFTVVAKLAILKAGGAYLPIDPAFPADHLSYVIGECAPKVIFTDETYGTRIRKLSEAQGEVIDLPALLPALDGKHSPDLPPVCGGDVAYVMYTSGSTGRPKGVAVPHRGVARLALDQDLSDTGHRDVILHTATISFDASTFEVWSALLNGATLAVMPKAKFALSDLFDVIQDNGVTIALLTTGLFNLFADCADRKLPTLRHMFFGGEAASAEHVRRFQSVHTHCRLSNVYGPTESSCIATRFTIPNQFQGVDMPIGKAIAETETYILNDSLMPVPANVEGQLALAGDGLATGYVHRSDLTNEKFVLVETHHGLVRCYLTGDHAVMGDDGTLFFRGRRDRQIKINGKRIELDEIEAVIRRDSRLLDGLVECHTHNGDIKRIVAYLRPKNEGDIDNPAFVPAVMEQLRNTLPPYMVPSAAAVLKEFPLTQAGKVDRSKLQPPPVESAKPATPESRSEELLKALWRNALGMEDVALDRNFFDLGGTSLQLLKVHANLEAELGRTIDVFALFKHPTIRELARFLDGEAVQSARSKSITERTARQRRNKSQFRRSIS